MNSGTGGGGEVDRFRRLASPSAAFQESGRLRFHVSPMLQVKRHTPHPYPMASQARHESVSPQELCTSRNVVPVEGRGKLKSVAWRRLPSPSVAWLRGGSGTGVPAMRNREDVAKSRKSLRSFSGFLRVLVRLIPAICGFLRIFAG
jgi:hypothetical protein